MYYPNLIPSLIEALDNGIGEGKAFSMDDLKDARELAIFGQVVWEACRYLWTCHLSHESNDGGEVLAEPKLRLDFIMRQCTYAEKGAVMQKSMDLEFLAECDEPTAALQPTAHRLRTTTEEAMEQSLGHQEHEAAGAEPYVPHVPGPSRFKVGQMVTVQYPLDTEGLPPGRYYGKVVETHDSIYLDGIRPDSGVTVELYREECDGESSETYGRPRLAGEQNWGGPEFSPLIQANDKHCTLAEPLTEPESVELAARLPYPAMEQSLESYEDGPIDGYDY